MAVELEVIEKRGSYYYREGESLAQGRENAKQFLREHSDVADQIEAVVRRSMASEEEALEPVAASSTEEAGEAD
jgi:recombination protein RecA